MSDLETQITTWRQQMLAAGIKAPVPLEELENHLRDVVEHQIHAGADASAAFEAAVRRIGAPAQLLQEFQQANTHERMNKNLRNIFIAIAVLAVALGFILPMLAKLRTSGQHSDAVLIANGALNFVLGAFCATLVTTYLFKRRARS